MTKPTAETDIHLRLQRMAVDVGRLTTLVAKGAGRRVSSGRVHYSLPAYPHELRADLRETSQSVHDVVVSVANAISSDDTTTPSVSVHGQASMKFGAPSPPSSGTLASIDVLLSSYDMLLKIALSMKAPDAKTATTSHLRDEMMPWIANITDELRRICRWGQVSLEKDASSIPTSLVQESRVGESADDGVMPWRRNPETYADFDEVIKIARRCGLVHRVFEIAHRPRQWSLLMLVRQLPGDISDLAAVFDRLGMFQERSVDDAPTDGALQDLIHESVDFYLNVIWLCDHLHPSFRIGRDGGGRSTAQPSRVWEG